MRAQRVYWALSSWGEIREERREILNIQKNIYLFIYFFLNGKNKRIHTYKNANHNDWWIVFN